MHYPICIEWGDENTATGIQIPDIPGAVTAGDTFEDAYAAAVEVAHIAINALNHKTREGDIHLLGLAQIRRNVDFEHAPAHVREIGIVAVGSCAGWHSTSCTDRW